MHERVIEIFWEETGYRPDVEARLDSLGLDSLDFLSLIVEIEKHFDARIPETAVAGFETVGDLIGWIEADACA